jgi:hypothetical protein
LHSQADAGHRVGKGKSAANIDLAAGYCTALLAPLFSFGAGCLAEGAFTCACTSQGRLSFCLSSHSKIRSIWQSRKGRFHSPPSLRHCCSKGRASENRGRPAASNTGQGGQHRRRRTHDTSYSTIYVEQYFNHGRHRGQTEAYLQEVHLQRCRGGFGNAYWEISWSGWLQEWMEVSIGEQ